MLRRLEGLKGGTSVGTKEREYPFPAKQFFSKNDSQNEMYEILYKSGKMVI